MLVDSSTNGMFVNDERVQGQRLLARADVIRIGEESFRFYSEQAAPQAAPAASAPAAPPPAAAARLQNTSFGMPATPRPTAPVPSPAAAAAATGPLANFLVRSGLLKGQRFSHQDAGGQYRARRVQRPRGAGRVGIHLAREAAASRRRLGAGRSRIDQRHVRGRGADHGATRRSPPAAWSASATSSWCSSRPTTRWASRRVAGPR